MRVNVILGGPSAEHSVSLASGLEVIRHLDRKQHTARAVVISQEKEFFWRDCTTSLPTLEQLESPASQADFQGPIPPALSQELWKDCDVAFLALHGSFGEDGLFQGFLETIGVPYTGSGVYASAVSMNKITTKLILAAHGITTPGFSIYGPEHPEVTVDTLVQRHGFPCFVKCPQSGSSKLMGRAANREQLEKQLMELQDYARDLLVESAVTGEEYSCPVLQRPKDTPLVLPPVLIKPVHGDFFDFEAKYTDGACEEIVPAPCSEKLGSRIQDTALRVHQLLGCEGVSRTDMILHNDQLHVLEINTLPGMTPNSLVPKSYAAQCGTYPELLDALIETAVEQDPTRGYCP
jgi:D-alanine-D-alanine ligase